MRAKNSGTPRSASAAPFAHWASPWKLAESFLAAIATIESLRHEVAGGGQQQQSFLENRLSPWLGMIALLVSQKEYAEALTFAEQSKARVLLDVLQAGRASLREIAFAAGASDRGGAAPPAGCAQLTAHQRTAARQARPGARG